MSHRSALTFEQDQNELYTQNALRVGRMWLGGIVITLIAIFLLTIQQQTWQLWSILVLSLFYIPVISLSLDLIRRGNLVLGVWVMMICLIIENILAVMLIADLGWVVASSTILLNTTLAAQTLPFRQVTYAIMISIMAGGVILLTDLYKLTTPYSVPILRPVISVLLMVVLIINVIIIVRQFPSYSLRTRFMLTFLSINLVSIFVIAFISLKILNEELTFILEQSLQDLSQAVVDEEKENALVAIDITMTRLLVLITWSILVLITIAALVALHWFTKPIIRLTQVAEKIAEGDLTQQAQIEAGTIRTFTDEISILAKAFDSITHQLRGTIDGLEIQVAERTQQIELVIELNHKLSSILDLDELMGQVVNTIKDTFDYYHVQIYLLDEQEENLVLAEGTGQVGLTLKQQGHHIALTNLSSLIAQSARSMQTIVVDDLQRQTGTFLPNPLLPETQAEMVVPIILEGKIVGLLDVQSNQVGRFGTQDIQTIEAVAGQLAIAAHNARLFKDTDEARQRIENLQSFYTYQAWEDFSAYQRQRDYEIRQTDALPSLSQTATPEVLTSLREKRTVIQSPPFADRQLSSIEAQTSTPINDPTPPVTRPQNAIATPLRVGNEVIGVLGFHDENQYRPWTAEEVALIEAVSTQMSLALENARLFEETGRQAAREKVIADATQQVWASGDIEKVLQTAVEQLGTTLDASKVVIHLGTYDELSASKGGDEHV